MLDYEEMKAAFDFAMKQMRGQLDAEIDRYLNGPGANGGTGPTPVDPNWERCPVWMGPQVSGKATLLCGDCHKVFCVCAHMEYERWRARHALERHQATMPITACPISVRPDGCAAGYVSDCLCQACRPTNGTAQLAEGVDFNRSPAVRVSEIPASDSPLAFLAELTPARPNPCPACYYAEHGMEHSYTSACKESG